jgi:hypothetical protein
MGRCSTFPPAPRRSRRAAWAPGKSFARLLRVLYVTGWQTVEVLRRLLEHFLKNALRLERELGKDKSKGCEFPLTPERRAVLQAVVARVDRIGREQSSMLPWLFTFADGQRVGNFYRAWRLAGFESAVAPVAHEARRRTVRRTG